MTRLMLMILLVGASACDRLPASARPTSCGGDQCASYCPAGTRCTLDGHCAPHCEQEQLQSH